LLAHADLNSFRDHREQSFITAARCGMYTRGTCNPRKRRLEETLPDDFIIKEYDEDFVPKKEVDEDFVPDEEEFYSTSQEDAEYYEKQEDEDFVLEDGGYDTRDEDFVLKDNPIEPALKKQKTSETSEFVEGDEEYFSMLHQPDMMSSHFEWAKLCLDGRLSETQKTPTKKEPKQEKKVATDDVKFELECKKETLQETPMKKVHKNKMKKLKVKRKYRKSLKYKQKLKKLKKPKKKTTKRCPCKKVPGWHGVFSRSALDGSKKYFILISIRGKKVYRGSFDTETECAKAYDDLVVKERGLGKARLNFRERYAHHLDGRNGSPK